MATREIKAGATPAASAIEETVREGLFVLGNVISRKRRQVALKDNKTRWVITLAIMGGGEIYRVDRWADAPSPSDTPIVGASVNLALRQRTFATKTGTKTSLEWGPQMDEGEF